MNVSKHMELGFDAFLYGIEELHTADIVVTSSQISMTLNNIKANMSYKLIMHTTTVLAL